VRIVVTGATGNVGTSVLEALAADERIEEIVGIARRTPAWENPRTRFVAADVERDDLRPHFAGADAVIHLAWLIQPSRDAHELERVNVHGSRRVFECASQAGVPRLVHASSIGVYSPGPKDRAVDESWPREGVPTSFYSRHKVAAEKTLDAFEDDVRIVRLRPALIFKREAAAGIRRLFAGPFLPTPLLHPKLLEFAIPDWLVLQAVHSKDVGEAYRLAATHPDARGAYNIAADPVLDAESLGARPVKLPPRVVRALADLTWRARLQPTPPGWLDMGLAVPVMDSTRARTELGWTPTRTATESLRELVEGMRRSEGVDTPPLAPQAGGPARVREVLAGVGKR
jgi:nucleoside-diphosphate-sugar epimerase